MRLYDPPLVSWLLSWCQCSYCYLVVVVQVELDLVLSSKQSAFQCAIRQAVREEQLIKNHMVLEHIRVLDRWKTEDLFTAKDKSCSGSSHQQEEKIGVDMMVNYKKIVNATNISLYTQIRVLS